MCAAQRTSSRTSLKIPTMAFCSVCLDAVVEGEGRSIARLTCGHSFHLDCIGSAFNAKGRMQCPNCRGVEQGRWLYANACCLNEDSVEDTLFEQETEVYRTAGVSQLNHSPWCPHQGLYEHTSLTFEELMNLGHGYTDSLQNSLRRRRICPYLVGVHNIPRYPSNMENSMSLRLYNSEGFWSHNAPRGAHHVDQARLAHSGHTGSWVPYWGPFRSHNHHGSNFHPNYSHQMFGFLLESYQSTFTRYGEGTDASGQSGQHMQNQVDYVMHRHLHPHTMSVVWNAQTNNRTARHGEVTRPHSHNYYVQRSETSEPTMHGHPSWAGSSTSQRLRTASYGDGVHWAAVGPHISYGVPAYWWAWTPFDTSHRNMATNPTRGGQFGSALRTS